MIKFSFKVRRLLLIIAALIYVVFVGPALISSKSDELALMGIGCGGVLIYACFRMLMEQYHTSKRDDDDDFDINSGGAA